MNISFFPGPTNPRRMESIYESDERSLAKDDKEIEKPLLEEEEIIMKFLKNPSEYRSLLYKLSISGSKVAIDLLKDLNEKPKNTFILKLFGILTNLLIIVLILLLSIYSFNQSLISICAGTIAFSLMHISEMLDILPSIYEGITKSFIKILKFLIFFGLALVFSAFFLSEREKLLQNKVERCVVESLMGICIGFGVAMIVIKPIKSFGKSSFE